MTLSVRDAAREHPDRIALALADRELSWAELAAHVARAEGFLAHAVPSGDPDAKLALTVRRRLDDVALVLAAIARGVPLVLVHPRLPDAARARLLATTDAALRVDDASALHLARETPLTSAAPAPPIPDARTLAVIFTSGSTGDPRGVVLSRRAFLASAAASEKNLGWQPDDRWLLAMPLAHVGGLSILVRALLSRTGIVMADERPFDAPELAQLAAARHATIASLVPTMLHRLLDHDPTAHTARSLRAILLGGAAAPTPLLERAADAHLPVLTTYGLTEACSQVTTQRLGTTNRGEQGAGPPLDGTTVRIIDGRVHVRGPTLCDRYLDAPALDDEGFLPTTDLGELDDQGRLHLRGRLEHRIITGGENVDPLTVERALLTDPRTHEACVIGLPDPEWGELVAAALVAPGLRSPDPLLATAAPHLAPHERPRRVLLVPALPLTPNGKVDRAAVRQLFTAVQGQLQ